MVFLMPWTAESLFDDADPFCPRESCATPRVAEYEDRQARARQAGCSAEGEKEVQRGSASCGRVLAAALM